METFFSVSVHTKRWTLLHPFISVIFIIKWRPLFSDRMVNLNIFYTNSSPCTYYTFSIAWQCTCNWNLWHAFREFHAFHEMTWQVNYICARVNVYFVKQVSRFWHNSMDHSVEICYFWLQVFTEKGAFYRYLYHVLGFFMDKKTSEICINRKGIQKYNFARVSNCFILPFASLK